MDPTVVTDPAGAASASLVLALLGVLVHKFVDFVKFVSAQDWTSALTQALAWAGGVFLAALAGASKAGAGVHLYGISLGNATPEDKVLIGLALGSAASVVKDFIKARDNTDSAAVPTWFMPPAPPVEQIQVEVVGGPLPEAVTPVVRP